MGSMTGGLLLGGSLITGFMIGGLSGESFTSTISTSSDISITKGGGALKVDPEVEGRGLKSMGSTCTPIVAFGDQPVAESSV